MAITTADVESGHLSHAVEPRRVLHFQHYGTALQHTILEADRIDARAILERAAAEVVYQHLTELPGWAPRDADERLLEAGELFRSSGLGVLDLTEVAATGGGVIASGSSFALGWSQRYGKSAATVCSASAGYLAGGLAAVFGRSFQVEEVECIAQGAKHCRFQVTSTTSPVDLADAGLEPAPSLVAPPSASASTVDEAEIVAALFQSGVAAGGDGHIQAFGQLLTRVWADYYNRISYRFEREVPRVMGNKFTNLASVVLTEAGHVCAYHTFGGILTSEEWRDRVHPLLRSREDWLHALVAVINHLGWGTWRVQSLVPGERLLLRVYDSYESTGYRRHFGRSATPRCYLGRGAAGALMNLLYVGDITTRPALSSSHYNELFRSPLSYRAVETRCRAMDDPYCELVVNPLSANLNLRLGLGR